MPAPGHGPEREMTPRERFAAAMNGQPCDRLPLFEEGIRDEVLAAWRQQGLAPGADLADRFTYDRRELLPVSLEPIPKVTAWPTSCRDLASLRERLDPDDSRRLPADWASRVPAWRSRRHLLQLTIHRGFFLSLGVGDWRRFTEAACLPADNPRLARGIMDTYADCYARLAERVLTDVQVDLAVLSEPIGGNDRPLLSPAQYREIVLPGYRRIVEALRRQGVSTIVFLSYANPRVLLPDVLDSGFTCLWACETSPDAMDYREIRREFGSWLGLIGGIDLDLLRRSDTTIRRRMTAAIPPLLAQGRYIPLADGRVRPDISLARYRCYRRLLERYARGSM